MPCSFSASWRKTSEKKPRASRWRTGFSSLTSAISVAASSIGDTSFYGGKIVLFYHKEGFSSPAKPGCRSQPRPSPLLSLTGSRPVAPISPHLICHSARYCSTGPRCAPARIDRAQILDAALVLFQGGQDRRALRLGR